MVIGEISLWKPLGNDIVHDGRYSQIGFRDDARNYVERHRMQHQLSADEPWFVISRSVDCVP